MAEKTTKKNTKGTKKVVEKKTTKKVTTKKEAPKKEVKKVAPAKEIKKVAPIKEEKVVTKKIEKKKGIIKENFDKIMENRPFAISLCIIIVLTLLLGFEIFSKRIPKTKDGKQVLASLKGKTITADDLYIELKNEYGTDKLLKMIDEYIINKESKLSKYDKEYIKDSVDSWKAKAEQDGTTVVQLANSYGLNINSEQELEDFITERYHEDIAILNFVGKKASEKELKEFYENELSDTLTVRHILIQVDGTSDEAEIKARKKAQNIIKELKDTKKENLEKKFIELAKDNSDDTGTFADGGLVKNFTKQNVVNEFFEASNKLKNGEFTTEPVKSSYGYHIIYKVDSTPLEKFEDIKEKVMKEYAREKLSSDYNLVITEWDALRKSYKLNIVDTDIKKAYEKNIGVAETED